MSNLAGFLLVVAVAAAWGGARYGVVLPAVCTCLMVAALAVQPGARRFGQPAWILAGACVLGVSFIGALDHELAVRLMLTLGTAALVFALARIAAADDRLVAVLAVALAATATVAAWQWLTGFGRLAGEVAALPPWMQDAALRRLQEGRVFGTASLPGHFAVLLLTAVPILVSRVRESHGLVRLAWSGVAGCAVAGILLTRSLAAIAIGALVLVVLARKTHRQLVDTALVVIAVVAAATTLARPEVLALEPLRLRALNMGTAVWAFTQHPWLGVGLGGVGQAGVTGPTAGANITPFAHNTVVQLVAELGIPGLALVSGGVVALVQLLRSGLRTSPALAAAVAIVPLHNLVDFSFYVPEVALPWAFLAGTLAARCLPLPGRSVPAWVLLPLLAAGTCLSVLNYRAELEIATIPGTGPVAALDAAERALRVAPWAATGVDGAAAEVLGLPAGRDTLVRLDALLARTAWVRPVSPAWAETRARVLLRGGRPGQARVWAREACRRGPGRAELRQLEALCGGS